MDGNVLIFTASHIGHLTNLVPMVQEEVSKDLALYLFDQSLA